MTSITPEEAAGGRDWRRFVTDNPPLVLTFVFIGLFILTDVINRAQGAGAFLTATQSRRRSSTRRSSG